jgi:hypothetical protein
LLPTTAQCTDGHSPADTFHSCLPLLESTQTSSSKPFSLLPSLHHFPVGPCLLALFLKGSCGFLRVFSSSHRFQLKCHLYPNIPLLTPVPGCQPTLAMVAFRTQLALRQVGSSVDLELLKCPHFALSLCPCVPVSRAAAHNRCFMNARLAE